jgi:uncharacterized protein (TIGR02246 family)
MLRRLMLTSALIALALPAAPLAYGQSLSQAEATKQVQDISSTFQEAYNKHDAAGLANLFTADGVFVLGAGKVLKGQDEIKQFYVKYFDGPGKNASDFTPTVDEVRVLGDGAWAIGHTSVMAEGKEVKTHWAATYRMGDGKLRADMLSVGANAPNQNTPQGQK